MDSNHDGDVDFDEMKRCLAAALAKFGARESSTRSSCLNLTWHPNAPKEPTCLEAPPQKKGSDRVVWKLGHHSR